MTLDRRQFLKSSLSGAAAFACWVKVPTLAHAKGRADLIRMTERPPNYESVRSTFTTRITPVERFYLRNHFDLPKIDVAKWRLKVHGLLEKALHPATLLALKMNGKPLAPTRGQPIRLVVPGWVGDDWVRALVDIEARADEPKAFYYDTAYRFPATPGAPGAPIPADQMKPMTKLNVKSLLGSLSDGDRLARGVHQLAGVAFSGEAGIERVELTFDGGKTWTAAKLDGPATAYGFRVFRHAWKAEPGSYELACRATDSAGATQPETPVWNPAGYLYNAIE